MRPKLGMTVLFRFSKDEEAQNNYSSQAPAVVVRVWSAETVNLKVITDGDADIWKTSVTFGDQINQWSFLPGDELAASA